MTAPIGWEHFFHEADIGVRGMGRTRAEAFEQAALALSGVLCDPELIRRDQLIPVVCTGGDNDSLLYAWLNAVIYEMAVRRMLFGRFCVRIEGSRLEAKLEGEGIDIARHQPAVEIKGATYTQLAVRGDDEHGWVAQCVVDV
jgi:SHS2 domain-containing protein